MVKEKVAHPQESHHPSEKPVIHCHKCGEPCKGEVLRVQARHFHIKCFTCKAPTAAHRGPVEALKKPCPMVRTGTATSMT